MTTQDVLDALAEQSPSAQAWLETAARETAVLSDHTSYVGLREYLAAHRWAPSGHVGRGSGANPAIHTARTP